MTHLTTYKAVFIPFWQVWWWWWPDLAKTRQIQNNPTHLFSIVKGIISPTIKTMEITMYVGMLYVNDLTKTSNCLIIFTYYFTLSCTRHCTADWALAWTIFRYGILIGSQVLFQHWAVYVCYCFCLWMFQGIKVMFNNMSTNRESEVVKPSKVVNRDRGR